MDLTSIVYFAIGVIGTFILNLNVFVVECGFLRYFVLFSMAIISLVVGQPFTFQVSKRDWPEEYWREKSFIFINNIVTGVWASIFLANSIVFLYYSKPFTVILSNALVISGVIFSIIFPSKMSEKLVLREFVREFKKFDWGVEVDTRRPKEGDEYDVIVVGAGIGGLTCGALLSKRGYKVLVLEQHYQVGGYCSSFSRRGFVFNTGVADVSGLWEKGPITYLLKELGLRKEDLFVKNRARYIFKREVIEVGDLEEFIEVLSKKFPEEKENIRLFFGDAKKAYEECYTDVEVYGAPLPPEIIVKVYGVKKLVDYPRERPHFYRWLNKTYKEILNEYFKNDDLKTLLCALLSYIGTEPSKTPASSALVASVSYYLKGGYFPKGGAQKFADTLKKVIEDYGGKVLTRHRVDRIIVENGEVKGVRVREKVFRSPIVVANANAKTTFLELVGEENLDAKFLSYVKSLRMSPSCFMTFLGVDMDLTEYPTLIKNLDDGYEIVINTSTDPTLAPKGKASITILTKADYHEFPERETEEYFKKKKELAKKLIKKAEKSDSQTKRKIIVQDAATPKALERYTSMPEGAIYSFDQSIETKRPYFKTPIKGLYLVGASTFPGGGIEATVISGIICANDICN
mgnify:CR=1 FL=1